MKKKDKNPSLVKIGTIYTISNMIVKGLTFIITPVFARIMTKQEYGDFSSIASWVAIIASVVTLDLYSAISIAKYDYGEDIEGYMSNSVILGNISTLFFYILIELNMGKAEAFFKMQPLYIRFIFLYLLFFPAFQILIAKNRMYNEVKQVIFLTIINAFISVLGQVVLVVSLSDKLLGRFLGNYVIVIICYFAIWLYILFKGRKMSLKYSLHSLKLAIPLIPHALSGIVLNSSDKIMIKSICGSEQNAIYSAAYTMAMIALTLLTSLNQAWVPWMYDRINNKYEEIKKASGMYSILFALICIGIELFGPEAIFIFGGRKYEEAKYLVPPVIFALMLQFVYTQYVNVEFYYKKNIGISIATVLAAIINVTLNRIFLPRIGYQVAAYTTIVGYLFMAFLHAFIVKVLLHKKAYFDEIKMLLSTVAVLVMSLISLVCYPKPLIRIFLIITYLILIGIFGFLKRKEIKILLKV